MTTSVLDPRKDPMGKAIADYTKNGVAGRLRVFSSMFDEDEIPVAELFRDKDEMPEIERLALDTACGHILDVGAGSGCHTLALQEAGKEVCAIDISPLSVKAMECRGVKDVRLINFFDPALNGNFDTILMLMNGSGIVGRTERFPEFFRRVDELLAPEGQLLMDSSDLIYLYEDENGVADIDIAGDYYGEVDFTMQYKNITGDTFDWLYIDFDSLSFHAEENGFHAERLSQGIHYDYLARLTRK
ncbi:MAG: class I SAM-dependent methyltransferase [Muribaculaceae bacterium]|nr:class I SAM-dependent methyltransferase [Muribaculaceae bacterium]